MDQQEQIVINLIVNAGSARSYGVQYNGGLVERNRMDFQGTV